MSNTKNWESPIDEDGSGGSPLLPPGKYGFVVKSLTKAVSKGDKTTGAPQAKLVLMVYNINDDTYANRIGTAYDTLTLHDDTWGMVCAFFRAIGERKHGETIVPKWDEVPGATGKAELEQHTFNEKTTMKVRMYLFPAEEPAEQPDKPDFG